MKLEQFVKQGIGFHGNLSILRIALPASTGNGRGADETMNLENLGWDMGLTPFKKGLIKKKRNFQDYADLA